MSADLIDDADDAAIAYHLRIEGECGLAASTPVDGLAYTGADRIKTDHGLAFRHAVFCDRLKEEELASFQRRKLDGADHRADNSGEHHKNRS